MRRHVLPVLLLAAGAAGCAWPSQHTPAPAAPAGVRVTDPAGDVLAEDHPDPHTPSIDLAEFGYAPAAGARLRLTWTVADLYPAFGAPRTQVFSATGVRGTRVLFTVRTVEDSVDIFDADGVNHLCQGVAPVHERDTLSIDIPVSCLGDPKTLTMSAAVTLYRPGPLREPHLGLDISAPGAPLTLP